MKKLKIKMQKSKLQLKNKKWDYVPILEYYDFERGTEPGRNAYNRDGEGIPFVRVGNVAAQIQEQIYTTSENIKLATRDDILLVLDGSPGVVIRGIEGAFSSGIRRVIARDTNELLKDFVFYVLQTNFVQKTIRDYSSGVTIKHASKSLEYIQIPLPPLSIQQKIVRVLDSVQEAVEAQEKLIEKTKELKKAMMAKLFREGIRGAKLKKTEIGKIPKNWEIEELRNITERITQTDPSKNPNKQIKYIDVSSISNRNFKIIEYKTFLGKDTPSRARKLVKTNDIIFATVRPYLKRIALIPKELNNEFCSTAFCVIRCLQNRAISEFIFNYIITDWFVNRVSRNQTGSGYPAVTDTDILSQKIPLPPLPEQHEIAEILQTIDQKIEIEQKKKALYEELFKTMLNKLMMREIEVDNLNLK